MPDPITGELTDLGVTKGVDLLKYYKFSEYVFQRIYFNFKFTYIYLFLPHYCLRNFKLLNNSVRTVFITLLGCLYETWRLGLEINIIWARKISHKFEKINEWSFRITGMITGKILEKYLFN